MKGRIGRQDYFTLAGPDCLCLSHPRSVQRVFAKQQKWGLLPSYSAGINYDILKSTSVKRFQQHLVASVGDGTRGKRLLGRRRDQLVGQAYHFNVTLWAGDTWYLPEYLDELEELIDIVKELDALGVSVFTEQFRCLTDRSLPSLSYVAIIEPSKGGGGYFTLKYWMHIIYHLPEGLNLVLFITDHCSCGIASGKFLTTPSTEMVALGCSYIGLPVDDYKYYAIYIRPRTSMGTIPRPIGYISDVSHWVRLFRENINALSHLLCCRNEMAGTFVDHIASFAKLRRLSHTRLSHGLSLKDICTINKFADMKNDAAYLMVSQATIELLSREAPEDTATLLVLEAAHYLVKVMRTRTFTNAQLAVEYLWRCATVFQLQARYIKKVEL